MKYPGLNEYDESSLKQETFMTAYFNTVFSILKTKTLKLVKLVNKHILRLHVFLSNLNQYTDV